MTPQGERTLIHRGKKFDLEMLRFTSASGRPIQREVVRHRGAVCILPILRTAPDHPPRIVMIRVHRFTLAQDLWELPAGTLEPNELPASCAARELIEETGYRADAITPLGSFYTTPGMTDERMHAFAAAGLTHVGQKLEEDEQIQPRLVTPAHALELLDSGELVDAKSIVTLTLALRKGLLSP
jgi:ADP-ribose pyrophosphatase